MQQIEGVCNNDVSHWDCWWPSPGAKLAGSFTAFYLNRKSGTERAKRCTENWVAEYRFRENSRSLAEGGGKVCSNQKNPSSPQTPHHPKGPKAFSGFVPFVARAMPPCKRYYVAAVPRPQILAAQAFHKYSPWPTLCARTLLGTWLENFERRATLSKIYDFRRIVDPSGPH